MGYFSLLSERMEKRRALSYLMSLDDRMLSDMGLARGNLKKMVYGRTTTLGDRT